MGVGKAGWGVWGGVVSVARRVVRRVLGVGRVVIVGV